MQAEHPRNGGLYTLDHWLLVMHYTLTHRIELIEATTSNRRVTVIDKNGYEKVHRIPLTEKNNEDTVSTASFGDFMSGNQGAGHF